MGCMYDKRTGLWCDGEQDVIDDWLKKKFGNINHENEKQCQAIYKKVVTDKKLYTQCYNLVKKNFHRSDEPSRDMTDIEFRFHLSFGLGTPFPNGELPTGEDLMTGKVFKPQKRFKPMVPNLIGKLSSGRFKR
jgi:hypothetical protein